MVVDRGFGYIQQLGHLFMTSAFYSAQDIDLPAFLRQFKKDIIQMRLYFFQCDETFRICGFTFFHDQYQLLYFRVIGCNLPEIIVDGIFGNSIQIRRKTFGKIDATPV
jgi:hypothetical protein